MQNIELDKAKCRICLDFAGSGVDLLEETILPKINAGFAYEIITGLKVDQYIYEYCSYSQT